MAERINRTCAPVHRRTLLSGLCAILAASALVCLVHWINAVTLRGVASIADYEEMDEGSIVALMEDVHMQDGVLYLSGALLRPKQTVGEVRVHVALLPLERGERSGTLIFLNTQMVRRYDLAKAYDCDDHCGFAAAAACRLLAPGEYAVALTDESSGEKRLVLTGTILTLGERGALKRVASAEDHA